MLALEGCAERAGYALGCAFSSSDEFEAAVIRSRVDAGVYGRKRHRRIALAAIAVAAAVLITIALAA
jgi:hypothetical protein